jgi:hypothetical protein
MPKKKEVIMKTFLLLLFCCSNVISQTIERKFIMGDFVVSVEGDRFSKNGRWLPLDQWPLPTNVVQQTNMVFAGNGHIVIKNNSIPVRFNGVKLSYNSSRNILIATAGTVVGNSNSQLNYVMDVCNIQLASNSLMLTPHSASAKMDVIIDLALLSGSLNNSHTILSSSSCNIKPDGSIFGNNFYGDVSFTLKQTEYFVILSPTDRHIVKLGTKFKGRPLPGVYLFGKATRDDGSYNFKGFVSPSAKQGSSTVTLNVPLMNRKPEIEYLLTLKSGAISYSYGPFNSFSCSGSFIADLTLPHAIRNNFDQIVQLKNIHLITDKSGALYNRVRMPSKIKVNPVFNISGFKDSVWIYFPNWHSPSNPTTYLNFDPKESCIKLFQLLEAVTPRLDPTGRHNIETRPGLTLNHGVIYFISPQIRCNPRLRANSDTIKAIFLGALTATPYGITGKVTSLDNSFILNNIDIEQSSVNDRTPQPTWDEILAAGNTKPNEPEEKYRLAGLRVLGMQIKELHLCMNEIDKSCFHYFVHFPWPSFIDLEFEDTSLDKFGRFHFAKGPLGTETWTFNSEQSATIIPELRNALKKGTLSQTFPDSVIITPCPVTKILWAWRLPVTFSDRGVIIKFNDIQPIADVSISMNLNSVNSDQEIVSSEIWVRPLYSKNSAIKAGVRFSGMLDSIGNFRLKGWDKDPFMAKMYSKPGTEEIVGFNCELKGIAEHGITLTDSLNLPSSRKVDFQWDGSIDFPFFGWLKGHFTIKNLKPYKLIPDSMSATEERAELCNATNKSLWAKVMELKFKTTEVSFKSERIFAKEIINNEGKGIPADSIVISSFTRGIIYRHQESAFDTIISDFSPEPTECGPPKEVQQILKDAIRSTEFIDIICYDTDANLKRGIHNICCNEYFLGTYQVNTRESAGSPEKTTLVVPNAMWFPDADRLDFQNSNMSLSSDDVDNPFTTTINIPGAQLNITATSIEGAFGATMATVASQIPYEGEFRFYLDTKCGYFYVQAAGSFTYFFRFTGDLFIVHAPLELLESPPPFIGVSQILDDLSIRGLFYDTQSFKEAVGFAGLDPRTIITGVFNSGGAQFGYDIEIATLKIAAGAGSYLFQFKSPTDNSYHIGTFLNIEASADIEIVTARGHGSLLSEFQPPNNPQSLQHFFSDSEFKMLGAIRLEGCVNLLLCSCCVNAGCTLTYTTKKGFDFSGFRPGVNCR